MTKLQWDRPSDRTYEVGLDQGVLYPELGNAVPWVGLVNVESAGTAEIKEYFVEGRKFLATVSARDYEATIEALTYPDEFADLVGISELGDGLYATAQMPGRFDLSYRTMVSDADGGEEQHYKIHLIYSAMAALGDVGYATLSDESEPTVFSFEITAVPQTIPNRRPTAHLIIDTRKIDRETRESIETILYGDDTSDARMPTPTELVDLMAFGDVVIVVDNGDGTWTATGSNANVFMTGPGAFQIHNVDATYLSEDVYRFGPESDEPQTQSLVLKPDDDGVVYVDMDYGPSNLALDVDEAPYHAPGSSEQIINPDDDGTPYFKPNSMD